MAVSLGSAVLTIGGDATGLHQALRHAEGVTRQTMMQMGQLSRQLGVGITAVGAGITTALTLATREAIAFESAFAGVRKTMDASEEEFAVINRELREMSREIPLSANELARIAELGGQLGVPKDAILEFTRVVAMLSFTTDMTSEAAATMIAQFMNITQTPWSDFDRLGATIVDLGNNGASTEGQIAEFGNRLAGAGKVAGLSGAEIYGFGSALASLGIDAEAGGTAFSRVFQTLQLNVEMGGKELENFSAVAGMTSQQFVAAWKDDPAQAVIAFVEGLGKIEAAGGSLFQTLAALDIKEIRLRDALLRTSGAGKLVADNITLANNAFAANAALAEEFNKRLGTTESQLTLLQNDFMEFARIIGETLAPYLRQLIEQLRPVVDLMIKWVQANPELTAQITRWAAVVGAAATAIGPLLIALPGIATAIVGIGAVMTAATAPVTLWAMAIGGLLVAAFYALRPVMNEARVWITANWDRIVTAFNSAKQTILLSMQILWQGLRIVWSVISAWMVGLAGGLFDTFTRISGDSEKYTGDFLGTIQMMLDSINELLPSILATVTYWANGVAQQWQTAVNWMRWFSYNIIGPIAEVGKWFIWFAATVLRSVSSAIWAIGQLKAMLGFGSGGGNFNIPPTPDGAPPEIPMKARGGTASGLTWVGERGPELVNLPRGSYVNTASESRGMMGGGVNMGGVTIHVSGVNDPDEIARQVGVRLERQIQNTLAKRGLRIQRA